MARTGYATEIHDTPQKSPSRNPGGPFWGVCVHHAALDSFEVLLQLEMGGRQVSSTVIIKDGRIGSMMDESARAWSLSSAHYDSILASIETCNSGGAAQGWPISEASYQSLAKVISDWCIRYNIPPTRERIMGHREVFVRYGASYATACPGGIDLDRLVAMVAQLVSGGSTMALKLIALSGSKDGLIVKGWHHIVENGHIRPLTSLENDYGIGPAGGLPTVSWQGEDIRTLGSLIGFMEYEPLPAGTKVTTGANVAGPGRITGRLIYADRSKPVDPAGGWTPTAADLAEIGRNVPAVNLTALETLIKGIPTAVDAALSDEQTQLVNLINGLPAAIRAKIIAP